MSSLDCIRGGAPAGAVARSEHATVEVRRAFLAARASSSMTDPGGPPVSTRIPSAIPPRWGFFKGLLTGAVIEVPALAAGVWLLARVGVGDPAARFMHVLRLAAVFAGTAAVLTAAGIGRLAAHASVDRFGAGRRRAMIVAARAHAVASIGLVMIAAIPLGSMPGHSWKWLAYPVAGALVGAACGAAIGLVCGGAAPVGIADVFALARTPGAALRQLLDPEDLVRLGAAVRQRTTHLFGGMFEPAKPPPDPAKADDEHGPG